MTPSLLGSLLSADRADHGGRYLSSPRLRWGQQAHWFLAFDLVVDEGATPEAEYATRLEKLESILSGGKRGKTIKTMSVSKGEVQGLYEELSLHLERRRA